MPNYTNYKDNSSKDDIPNLLRPTVEAKREREQTK